MFREYVSIPQVRLACQISERGEVTQLTKDKYLYTEKVGAISERMEFSSDAEPTIGDYIVTMDNDYLLISKVAFEERFRSTTYRIG